MKKILLLCVLSLMFQANVEAKDYIKHQIKEMKKSQQYSATNNYFVEENKTKSFQNFEIKDPKLIKLSEYQEISTDKLKAKKTKDEAEEIIKKAEKIADFVIII